MQSSLLATEPAIGLHERVGRPAPKPSPSPSRKYAIASVDSESSFAMPSQSLSTPSLAQVSGAPGKTTADASLQSRSFAT